MMKLTLTPARLIKRYKRFLADVILPNNDIITVHCANTGAMTGCASEGDRVWLQKSDNPKRKYAYSWILTETQTGDFICVHTHFANHLAQQAIAAGLIPFLPTDVAISTEVKFGLENSRVDIVTDHAVTGRCFIEVKSVTLLAEQQQGFFPDAVTLRGQKHLRELMALANSGTQAALLFVVMHTGIDAVSVAGHIDPVYAKLFAQAKQAGVKINAVACSISPEAITVTRILPVV